MARPPRKNHNRTLPHGEIPKSDRRKAAALAVLSDGGSPDEAAAAAGISRALLYKWKTLDPAFNAQWEEARDITTEKAEAEIYRRGVVGWVEPIFGKGPSGTTQVVGSIRKYSDRMLEVLIKARKPNEYRDNPRVAVAAEVQVGDAKARLIALVNSTADALAQDGEPHEADRSGS